MSKAYVQETQKAIESVIKSCELASKMQGTLEALDVVNKEDLSPVTITDFSCQALINMHLLHTFPHDPIMGEEDALFLRNPQNRTIKAKVVEQIGHFYPSVKEEEILDAIDKGECQGGKKGRFWVIDPIDGTRGFIRNEQYCIALALIEEGEVVLAVLGCPRLLIEGHRPGGLISAVKGQGASLIVFETGQETKMKVAPPNLPGQIIYCEPHSSSTSHHHTTALEVAKELDAYPKPFRLDSQCKYALVAIGEASVYLRIPVSLTHREKIWDHAPGTLIVEEAGGRVTDLQGIPLDFSQGKTLSRNRGLLVTNGALHDKALEAIRKVLPKTYSRFN